MLCVCCLETWLDTYTLNPVKSRGLWCAQAAVLPHPSLAPLRGTGYPGGDRGSGPPALSRQWPALGRVESAGVTLRYAGQSAPALSGLDLDVAGGRKIGICGRTGTRAQASIS